MRLQETCSDCGAVKVLALENTRVDNFTRPDIQVKILTYKCGHSEWIEINLAQLRKIQSLDGAKQAYKFQIAGIKFLYDTNVNGLIADAMGLGKTIQALLTLRNKYTDLTPCLIVVKSATTFQWLREFKEWCDNSDLGIFPIIGTTGIIPPGFKSYVISMDTLGRNGTWKKLLPLGIKLVIADECHSFKDPSSQRTKALINLIQNGRIQHKILLSGTPIKNRANEYFTALNLLSPAQFPSMKKFKSNWLDWDGKRLNQYRVEQFRDTIAQYVLRREKHEVLQNLPSFTRNFQFVSIDDPLIKNSYNRELDLFSNALNSQAGLDRFSILGWLATLRRIMGLAKVPMCVEYIEEFLENTDDKIAIGIQHKGVRDTLYAMLQKWNPLKLSGEDSAWGKDQIVQRFSSDKHRVLVINELAGGIGLNLQMCANTLILERQWNSADEEQFESRFHRNGQTRPVIADYLIAHGTIDEWFHNMVEMKRKIFGETIQGWEFTSDAGMIRDLADKTVRNKL